MDTLISKKPRTPISSETKIFSMGGIIVFIHYWVSPIPFNVQALLCAITIITLGIPHGALDHVVEARNKSLQDKKFSMSSFLFTYLVKMAVFGLCWIIMPAAALVIFLLISAIHFGETDISLVSSSNRTPFLLKLSHGMLILAFLLISHASETIAIVETLPLDLPANLQATFSGNRILWLQLITSVLHCFVLGIYAPRIHNFTWGSYLAKTVLLIMMIIYLPLLLAFTFYFGFWHSVHALRFIRFHLSEQNTPLSWSTMIRKAIPFTLAAIAMLAILTSWAAYAYQVSLMLMCFFVGIAILTAPHMDVMHKMYDRSKR